MDRPPGRGLLGAFKRPILSYSFLVMVALAVVVSVILSTRLNRNVELLEDHGAAMMAGTMIKEQDSFSIPSLQ